MSDAEHASAPAELDAVRHRRGEIGDAIASLERALSAPAGAGEAWKDGVTSALGDLGRLGREQRVTISGDGGLIDDLRAQRPRLVTRAQDLDSELEAALGELDALALSVDELEPVDVRERALPFLGHVVRLRQAVADLVWDAYWVDVGGPG